MGRRRWWIAGGTLAMVIAACLVLAGLLLYPRWEERTLEARLRNAASPEERLRAIVALLGYYETHHRLRGITRETLQESLGLAPSEGAQVDPRTWLDLLPSPAARDADVTWLVFVFDEAELILHFRESDGALVGWRQQPRIVLPY